MSVDVGPGIDLNGVVSSYPVPAPSGVGVGVVLPSAVASGAVVNVPKTVVHTVISESFYYEHVQSTPASEWTIHHNLGKRPNISVYDSDGNEVLISVKHLDENTAHIIWPAPTAGEAYCS